LIVSKAICRPFSVVAYVPAPKPVRSVNKPTVREPFGKLPVAELLPPPGLVPAAPVEPALLPPDELHAADNATDARRARPALSLALLIRYALSLEGLDVGGVTSWWVDRLI
jgi:hypothetical protein